MPQMAPMSWLLLFLIFSASLMIFIILNYFMFLPPASNLKISTSSLTSTKQSMNWKW